jgi:hypothetical protein
VGRGQLGLSNVGSALDDWAVPRLATEASLTNISWRSMARATHLVGLMSGRGGGLTLLAGGELSQVSVVVALPMRGDKESDHVSYEAEQARVTG